MALDWRGGGSRRTPPKKKLHFSPSFDNCMPHFGQVPILGGKTHPDRATVYDVRTPCLPPHPPPLLAAKV